MKKNKKKNIIKKKYKALSGLFSLCSFLYFIHAATKLLMLFTYRILGSNVRPEPPMGEASLSIAGEQSWN